MKPTKMPKIYVTRKRAKQRAKIVTLSRETSEELLHMAIAKRGFARLSIGLHIRHHATNMPVNWKGTTFRADVSSIAKAREFRDELLKVLVALAERVGAVIP